MQRTWIVAEACPADFVSSLAPLGVSPLVAQLLWNRGVRSADDAQAFLQPSWEAQVHPSEGFVQMRSAVTRIFQALERGERITVHGDYDADGVTGSTVLITALREIEKREAWSVKREAPDVSSFKLQASNIDFYLPHRDKEGYGLHAETVKLLAARGTRLIITVDCGIACPAEIAQAKALGMDTIVVDHHQLGEELPDAILVHPSVPGESYPFKSLAAVGVSFKLAQALVDEARQRNMDIPTGWEKWLLDLVAIATVTDMVPLTGENRALESYGLRVLNRTRRPGLRALVKSAGLTFGSLDAESVAFGLGPRINAAGRMDHASLALKLLLSESDDEAALLSQELERKNRERQEAMRRMMGEAEEKIEASDAKIIMLWDEAWSPALVGLVAGRLLERFFLPTVAVGQYGGNWIGSGRSMAAYDITDAMRSVGEGLLTRVGGHVQACGFGLDEAGHLPTLRDRIMRHADERLDAEALRPVLKLDAEAPLTQVTLERADELEHLAPFGEGNPKPAFVARNVFAARIDRIGATGQHLRCELVAEDGRRVKAIGFKMGERADDIRPGVRIDVAYRIALNEWNGRKSAEAHVIDVCPV